MFESCGPSIQITANKNKQFVVKRKKKQVRIKITEGKSKTHYCGVIGT